MPASLSACPLRGKTTDWRAGCGRSASPVRREGRPDRRPYPYPPRRILGATPQRSLNRAAATDESHDDDYDSRNEQDVNQSVNGKGRHQANKPEDQQNYSDCPEHKIISLR